MPLDNELTERMKAAMKARDQRTLDVIRMIKSRVKERQTAPGFSGEVDDALITDVIATYVKQMEKAAAEYERLGPQGAAAVEQLRFEIDYLKPFLPEKMDRDETRALLREIAAAQGITDKKQAGRLVGAAMKTHRDQLDPALAREVADELLA